MTDPATHRAAMLAMLDRVRAEIERGDTVALIMLPVHPGRTWSTRTAGDMSHLEIVGMLAVTQTAIITDIEL